MNNEFKKDEIAEFSSRRLEHWLSSQWERNENKDHER